MIDDFFDWLFGYGRGTVAVVFLLSAVLFSLGLSFAFIIFNLPLPLLRLEILTATIMLSIFIIWYFKVYKK